MVENARTVGQSLPLFTNSELVQSNSEKPHYETSFTIDFKTTKSLDHQEVEKTVEDALSNLISEK